MENLITAFSCVVPTFLYMLVGYVANNRKIVPHETFANISRFAFAYLLPWTLFNNIYPADLSSAFSAPLVGYLVTAVVTVYVIGSFILFRTEKNPRRRGLYIQNLYRSNIAIIGVTLAQPLMDEGGLACISIIITFLVPVYNAFAIIALELCRGSAVDAKHILVNVSKNPLIRGALGGILCVLLGIHLPSSVETAIAGLAKSGSVMTLISLGATLQFSSLRKNAALLTRLTLVRLVGVPALLMGIALALGFRGTELAIILICTASPLASSTYPMALVYDSDYDLTGQLVVTTSLFCCLTLFLWIFLFKQLGLF